MKTLRLTAEDFKETDNYWKDYVGKEDLSDFKGNLEIEGNLGCVKFSSLCVSGYIIAEAGTGIKAGRGIKAGEEIEVGTGIKAVEGIEAGWGIEAGEGIEAGWGIEAGEGIKAGWGIKAGLFIFCNGILTFSYKIFAGICYWRDISDDEKTITCGRKEGDGVVEYGILKELGMPQDNTKKQELLDKAEELKIKAEELIQKANEL